MGRRATTEDFSSCPPSASSYWNTIATGADAGTHDVVAMSTHRPGAPLDESESGSFSYFYRAERILPTLVGTSQTGKSAEGGTWILSTCLIRPTSGPTSRRLACQLRIGYGKSLTPRRVVGAPGLTFMAFTILSNQNAHKRGNRST